MSTDTQINSIISAVRRINSLGLVGNGLSVRQKIAEASCLEVCVGASGDISPDDIKTVSLDRPDGDDKELRAVCFAIFAKKPDAAAIISASTPYLLNLSRINAKIPPILDDFAQIIGINMKTADGASAVPAALKGRNACMLKDKGAIIVGRTLDEAVTALLVAEKTAKTYALASALGKPAPISTWEAALMNFVYKKKYSKISKE
ncbi:MAG: class II aldolase/adducin family protein [Clostridiales bacterium]|jgi:ribulose-5-phosphate 4-epimerase/fuculose-1-phosphate aldolase|nr:class II aldolase/adducin family protein [Clostridiales bacterium]